MKKSLTNWFGPMAIVHAQHVLVLFAVLLVNMFLLGCLETSQRHDIPPVQGSKYTSPIGGILEQGENPATASRLKTYIMAHLPSGERIKYDEVLTLGTAEANKAMIIPPVDRGPIYIIGAGALFIALGLFCIWRKWLQTGGLAIAIGIGLIVLAGTLKEHAWIYALILGIGGAVWLWDKRQSYLKGVKDAAGGET